MNNCSSNEEKAGKKKASQSKQVEKLDKFQRT
jgi:hypothetical protein